MTRFEPREPRIGERNRYAVIKGSREIGEVYSVLASNDGKAGRIRLPRKPIVLWGVGRPDRPHWGATRYTRGDATSELLTTH